jgi:glycosyltransferase involved in cell wall biosynthesis
MFNVTNATRTETYHDFVGHGDLQLILVCLIRSTDLSGRLGGGLRRFVEIGARIHTSGVRFIILESEPFLKGFSYFGATRALLANHDVVSFHFAGKLNASRRMVGPIVFWLRPIATALLAARTIRSARPCLILAPGETMAEVLATRIASLLTSTPGAVIVQSDPFLFLPPFDASRFGSVYSAYRTKYHPLVSFTETLTGRIHARALNRMPLIVVGSSLAQRLRSRGITGAVEVIVENGIDLRAIAGTSASPTHSDAIYVGRVDPSKDVVGLIRTWVKLSSQHSSKFTLLVAGPIQESLRAELETQDSSSGHIVTFLGPMTDEQVIGHMKSSRVFVLPSGFESFSLVTAESLACGVPVVCYDSPGISEFFSTPAVIKVPNGDMTSLIRKTLNLLEKEEERVRLGRIGAAFVSRYNWNNVAENEARIYRELANRPSNGTIQTA